MQLQTNRFMFTVIWNMPSPMPFNGFRKSLGYLRNRSYEYFYKRIWVSIVYAPDKR